MPTNFYMLFVAAIIPLLIGAIYYHPKVFGNTWMRLNGFTEETMKTGNMAVIFGMTYLFGVFIAFTMMEVTIHQGGAAQMMMPGVIESGSETQAQFNQLMEQYGDNFRSFKHGALHGVFFSIFLVLPLIGINALYERRGWKYIFIHVGYWAISLGLMGGLLCETLQYAPLS